jgi:hypothetical protein
MMILSSLLYQKVSLLLILSKIASVTTTFHFNQIESLHYLTSPLLKPIPSIILYSLQSVFRLIMTVPKPYSTA